LFEDGAELLVGDVLLVERDIEFTLHLGAGPLSIAEEANELNVASTIESLSDIVHHRTGSTLNLVAKAEVLAEVAASRPRVDPFRQLPRVLPGFYVFEPADCHR